MTYYHECDRIVNEINHICDWMGGKIVRISRDKVDICRARKKKSVADLAEAYGVSRARMNVILNQREVSVVSAGRLADALECYVTEILEG